MDISNLTAETIASYLGKSETQVIIICGLCVMGAWVFLTWMVRVIIGDATGILRLTKENLLINLLWPLTVFTTVMFILIPAWRTYILDHVLSDNHANILDAVAKKILQGVNSTVYSI